MAVIVTNREKPVFCNHCWNNHDCSHYKLIPEEWGYSYSVENCPLKSIDELLDKLNNSCTIVDLEDDKKFISLDDINKIIKEFCENKN